MDMNKKKRREGGRKEAREVGRGKKEGREREIDLYLNSEFFQLQTALQKSRTTYIQIKNKK